MENYLNVYRSDHIYRHRNMNSIEGATLLAMQRPKNSKKRKT